MMRRYCDYYSHAAAARRTNLDLLSPSRFLSLFPFVFISLSHDSGRVFHFHLPRGPRFSSRDTWRVNDAVWLRHYVYIYTTGRWSAFVRRSIYVLFSLSTYNIVININLNTYKHTHTHTSLILIQYVYIIIMYLLNHCWVMMHYTMSASASREGHRTACGGRRKYPRRTHPSVTLRHSTYTGIHTHVYHVVVFTFFYTRKFLYSCVAFFVSLFKCSYLLFFVFGR